MTAIAIADLSKKRDPNAARWVGIGGGDLPALLGWSRRATEWTVYQRKVGSLPREPMNEFMRDGIVMEKVICEWWAERHARDGLVLLDTRRIYRHPEHPWAVAAPDRLVLPAGVSVDIDKPWWPTMEVLETKSVYDPEAGRELRSGQVPLSFWAQCQWYAEVFDVPLVRLAAKVGPYTYELLVERDRKAGQDLLAVGAAMWRRIEERDPPEMGTRLPQIDLAAVARMFPDADNRSVVQLSPEALEALAAYRQLKADEKELKNEIAACRLVVEFEMGRCGVAKDAAGNTVATWKQAKPSNKFDQELWAAKAPKQASRAIRRYRRETLGSRRFVLPKTAGEDNSDDE